METGGVGKIPGRELMKVSGGIRIAERNISVELNILRVEYSNSKFYREQMSGFK